MTTTPEILRAIALGVDRLNDGDSRDRMTAEAVIQQVYVQTNLAWDGDGFVPPQDITRGYIKGPDGTGEEVWVDVKGQWRWRGGRIHPGMEIYLDEGCSLFVCRAVDRPAA